MANNPYRAVLFDLDGVLLDMQTAHYEALNGALALFDATIATDEHDLFFDGLPSKKKLSLLAEQGRVLKKDISTINKIKQENTKKIIPSKCTPDKQKISMLRELKDAGFKLGCCTNSTHEMAILMLQSAELLDYFEIVIGNDSVKNPKPDPEMYLSAMQRLGVTPTETIIIEDSQYGIEAARASGANVYVVKGTEDVHIGLFGDILTL